MALRKALAKRLFDSPRSTSPAAAAAALPSLQAVPPPPAASAASFHREYVASPAAAEKGLLRRFLQRRAINQAAGARLPEFLSLPVGDKLRERLRSLNGAVGGGGGERLRLGGLSPPVAEDPLAGVSVGDVRRLLRLSRAETIKAKLRGIGASSISYDEFVGICDQACGGCEEEGAEFAKALDESGNVIVHGNVVFLRPEQVAESVESLLYQSMAGPNDPRRRELEQMEKHKALIDEKARAEVKAELYCGLGFLVAQTLVLMRLTFWELTWDVMEPICFFLTNLHVALAYGFFLRTSTEPSYEGYFQRRFKTKQQKLMRVHNFDAGRYRELCRAFYPDESRSLRERL